MLEIIDKDVVKLNLIFHGRDRYHIETSPLICRAKQWTSFYMITVSVMKELIVLSVIFLKKLVNDAMKLQQFSDVMGVN